MELKHLPYNWIKKNQQQDIMHRNERIQITKW